MADGANKCFYYNSDPICPADLIYYYVQNKKKAVMFGSESDWACRYRAWCLRHVIAPDFPSRKLTFFFGCAFRIVDRTRASRPPQITLFFRVNSADSILRSTSTMSMTSQAAARCCRQLVRPSTSLRLSAPYQQTIGRRWQSAEAAAPANPKITQIVDQISQLNLLETADLVASLKVRPPITLH